VFNARLRGRLSAQPRKRLQHTFRPLLLRINHPQNNRFPALCGLIDNLIRGLSAEEQRSFSIDRPRRNHQRLPSSLLIEDVSAICATASHSHLCAATSPIKANDFSSMWRFVYNASVPDAPCIRIVPKNLFLSAQRALSEEVVHAGKVRESNIRDLCTLIDLSVLYEGIETLGSDIELREEQKPHISPEYENIRRLTGLTIKVGPAGSEFENVLRHSLTFAIQPFARSGQDVALDELKAKIASSLRIAISGGPDYWEEFAEGERLLTKPLNQATSDPEKFWLRSFLYAGFASARSSPLVPDAIRSWGMRIPGRPPSDYGQELQRVIEGKYPPDRMRALFVDSPFPVPPFAAVVFLRADNDPTNVPRALKDLRDELAPVRIALGGFQRERDTADYRGLITIFGKAHTPGSRVALDERMRDAVEALRKLKLPIPPQLLVLKPIFNIVKSASALVANLISASPQAFKAGKDLLEASP
jgi:hypothetical protein